MANIVNKENLVPKRQRIKYKPEQVEMLERMFEENHYPDSLQQERLALDLGITLDRISIWFQNRRSKFKRQRQADHMTWMRKQIFQSKDELNSGSKVGTPKLPHLSSACHVLSPIETRVPRDDSAGDLHSVSSSPVTWNNFSRPFIQKDDQYYHLERNTTCRFDTNLSSSPTVFSTPTRLGPEYDFMKSPYAMIQSAYAPTFDMFQTVSHTSTSFHVPSMHSVAQDHMSRSLSDENERNSLVFAEQQLQFSSEVQDTRTMKKSQSFQRAINSFEDESSLIVDASGQGEHDVSWLHSSNSPSKDKAIECLAHWC